MWQVQPLLFAYIFYPGGDDPSWNQLHAAAPLWNGNMSRACGGPIVYTCVSHIVHSSLSASGHATYTFPLYYSTWSTLKVPHFTIASPNFYNHNLIARSFHVYEHQWPQRTSHPDLIHLLYQAPNKNTFHHCPKHKKFHVMYIPH